MLKTTNTPKNAKGANNNKSVRNSSEKKLVQARLPFKIITPGSTTATVTTTAKSDDNQLKSSSAQTKQPDTTKKQGSRKRKLSFDISDDNGVDDVEVIDLIGSNLSKAEKTNVHRQNKEKELEDDSVDKDIVVILEDDNDDDDNNYGNNDDDGKTTSVAKETPKLFTKGKRKGAGTPQSVDKPNKRHSGNQSQKVQIKLALPSKNKKKRLKSKFNDKSHSSTKTFSSESSDELEAFAVKLNPKKRKKIAKEDATAKQKTEIIILDSDISLSTDAFVQKVNKQTVDVEDSLLKTPVKEGQMPANSIESIDEGASSCATKVADDVNEGSDNSVTKSENPQATDKENITPTKSDESIIMISPRENAKVLKTEKETTPPVEFGTIESTKPFADARAILDERDDDEAKSSSSCSASGETELNMTTEIETDQPAIAKLIVVDLTKSITDDKKLEKKKMLTPKQLKLMEQRKKAREEKERKLQEEKEQKQREKEERELSKKREREEKEDLRRKEKEEKEDQRRKEKEEKEKKRLAEIEVKNEEKRKRNEAKEEEIRKKEEDRKRKEQEKEEIELKKKKAAEAFTKFFVPKSARSNTTEVGEQKSQEKKETIVELMAFRPFQIKGDMKLAPIKRKILASEARKTLDAFFLHANQEDIEAESMQFDKMKLYLAELKSGSIIPAKSAETFLEAKEDDDICIVEDELERVAETVEETHAPIERHRAKFFSFAENRRPAYYGTFRKNTEVIKPRRPFAQDTKLFDYEIDSDLEWEEEEPGESLNGSEDDKESDDDEYEVDNEWFVPHGHLSEEEMQNEDEFGLGNESTREAQQVKLKMLQQEFAQQMKKKTEKLKPRLIGCIWVDENGNKPENCPQVIWNALNLRAMLCDEAIVVGGMPNESEDADLNNSPISITNEKTIEKLKPIDLTDDMIKDLIRLVHGNRNSKVFLINEFIAYIKENEDSIKNGDLRGPLKSAVREKIDEYAAWQITERAGINKKKKIKKHLCWVVGNETLKKMGLEDLTLNNNWKYVLQPKTGKLGKTMLSTTAIGKDEINEITNELSGDSILSDQISTSNISDLSKAKQKCDMKKFTKILTTEERLKQMQEKSMRNDVKDINTLSNATVTNVKVTAAPIDAATTISTQVAAPASTQVAAPESTQVAVPESTQVAAPASTQVAAPASTQVAASASTQVAAPASTQVAAPASTQVAAPASTQVAAPASTQVAAPASTQVAAPASTQVTAPASTQAAATTPVVKKRVPLLMSVPVGHQINVQAKNALISQFLLKNKTEVKAAQSNCGEPPTALPTASTSPTPPTPPIETHIIDDISDNNNESPVVLSNSN